MDKNTGYIITHRNLNLISNITGMLLKTLEANIGWVAVYQEDPFPRWSLMPRKTAEGYIKDFEYVDSPLNGLPTRSIKEIRDEWTQVNKEFREKLEELQKELDRAKLIEEDDSLA